MNKREMQRYMKRMLAGILQSLHETEFSHLSEDLYIMKDDKIKSISIKEAKYMQDYGRTLCSRASGTILSRK